MAPAEGRLAILSYLRRKRHATMTELADEFGVTVRTIQRDIYEIEASFHAPIDVKCGKYDGGVYIVGDYTFDRMYMCEEELRLLCKAKQLLANRLSDKESALLEQIIRNYTKPT